MRYVQSVSMPVQSVSMRVQSVSVPNEWYVLNIERLISGMKRMHSQSSWKKAESVQQNKEGRLGWMKSIHQTRSAIALNLQFIKHLNETSVNNAIDVWT